MTEANNLFRGIMQAIGLLSAVILLLALFYFCIAMFVGVWFMYIGQIPFDQAFNYASYWILTSLLFIALTYGTYRSAVSEVKQERKKKIEKMTENADIHEIHLN